jgi:hypothetical protein
MVAPFGVGSCVMGADAAAPGVSAARPSGDKSGNANWEPLDEQ